MVLKILSSQRRKRADKSLSNWERAISEAKQRIVDFKRSIRTMESLRDQGMEFPAPSKRGKRTQSQVLGQDSDL